MYNSLSTKMNTTQMVNFQGETIVATVTDKAALIDQWMAEITPRYITGNQTTVVGLDMEWRPNVRRPFVISTTNNRSATLQLCIDTKCLIIQLFYLDYIPQSLRDFMARPNFVFVGVQVGEDAEKLLNEYGVACASTRDTQARAMDLWPNRWYRNPGLKALARDLVGLNMAKPLHVCRSDWQARVLSEAQVEYACIDAYASYKIGHRLFMENSAVYV